MMTLDIYTILANAGSAGIVGLMFIAYLYFQNKSVKDRLIAGDKEKKDERGTVAKDLLTENKIEDERLTRSEVKYFLPKPAISQQLKEVENDNLLVQEMELLPIKRTAPALPISTQPYRLQKPCSTCHRTSERGTI